MQTVSGANRSELEGILSGLRACLDWSGDVKSRCDFAIPIIKKWEEYKKSSSRSHNAEVVPVKADRVGSVYVFCHSEYAGDEYWSKYVKIGHSTNVKQRLEGANTWIPSGKLILYYATQSITNSAHIETILHRLLESKRANGEWFMLSPDAAVKEIKGLQPSFHYPDRAAGHCGDDTSAAEEKFVELDE